MMTEQDNLIKRLRMKLQRFKKTGKYTILDGISEEVVTEKFAQENLDLPDELRIWLGLCNGIGGFKKSIPVAFGVVYGTDPNPRLGLNMFFTPGDSWERNGWIPIADDGCGNYYALVPQGEEDRKQYVVAFFEASSSRDALHDTPTYISCYDCLSFMNLLLLEEILYVKDSQMRVFSRFFEGGADGT